MRITEKTDIDTLKVVWTGSKGLRRQLRKRICIFFTIAAIGITLLFTGCLKTADPSETEGNSYRQVSAQEAKRIMDEEDNYVILDVRTKEEYDEAHIPGAILIPDYEIESRAENELKDHDQLILVYCRSGNRSKKASQKLSDLGYSNVVEFGGINSWPYDIEKQIPQNG